MYHVSLALVVFFFLLYYSHSSPFVSGNLINGLIGRRIFIIHILYLLVMALGHLPLPTFFMFLCLVSCSKTYTSCLETILRFLSTLTPFPISLQLNPTPFLSLPFYLPCVLMTPGQGTQ